ncbi:transporter substrate-binding domain-containing protein [Terasakiella sp. A23]|uniref:substrate-binding periplasmic protein n=1 Tax=Terasakiella sp. FCG-A23 TaxID=3080561 RepID=UPI00295313F9|nr:transporter substrate-binding domain-containing protein [Terasakiella sp. A23]MDV7340178.1 transporter substrate-binding domain-containing protein [Terasakiella sp. A23]
MKLLFILACALGIFMTGAAQAGKNEKLVFGSIHFPPYTIVEDDKSLSGFDAELVIEGFKRLDIPVEIKIFPWKRVIQQAENGEITGAISCSPRPKKFYITQPTSRATDAFFFLNDFDFEKHPIATVSDLRNSPDLTVGGVNGYKHLQLLESKNIQYDSSPDDDTGFKKLFAGRIDIFLTIQEFGNYTLKQLDLSDMATSIPLRTKRYHLCISKAWPGAKEIHEKFDQVLKEMREDGTYDKIHAKYK